jgi:nitroimidazol reductase NimA-like FMN-containing flavoprotein (pyridoxamine 5'-phosphate oxidase superfamily)
MRSSRTTNHTGNAIGTPSARRVVRMPVWFVVLDERIYIGTPAHTKKVKRLRRDPVVSFLVESGQRWAELRGVHLTGQARVVDDPELRDRVQAALREKYEAYTTKRAAMPEATRRHYEVETAVIEIVPDERILSWDNARLPLRS